MKESVDSTNRKLIRPSLNEVKENLFQQRRQQQNHQRPKRSAPPDQTNAENFYYIKQMQNHTPMVVVLNDGETLRGRIEWYDKNCLKLNCTNGPNVLVYKASIKYLFKASDSPSQEPEESAPNGSGAGSGPNGSAHA